MRAHFDVVLRKLIPKLQAFSKRIQETPMVRFYSSIYADDKVLIRQMSCVSAFHGSPHQIAAAHRTKTECLDSVPDAVQLSLIRVRNSLFLTQRRDICGGSCRNATGLGAFLTFLQVVKSLGYKPDRRGVLVFSPSDAPAFHRWSDAPRFPASSPTQATDHSCPTNNRAEQAAYCWRRARMGYRVRCQDRVDKNGT